jgi:L-aspartate oxidase
MEFIQFHPTCLYHPHVKNFLISEAVRGEGGRLLLPDGTRFMPNHDPRLELAPRDVVARAIDHEVKRLGLDYVHLDISHRDPEFVKQHFPNIHDKLLTLGIDITTDPIPVVPAQHYTCGGVVIDLDGRTDLPGLYAAGEVSESGLHGANRLASNSLLECFVFGEAAAKHITENWDDLPPPPPIRPWDESRVTDSDEEVVIKQNWTEIRRFMWNYVGIVRTTKRLERAAHRIKLLNDEVGDYYGHFRVTPDLVELRNLLQTAELIVRSALHRHESRGLHYTLDYPKTLAKAVDTVLAP